MKIIVDLQLPEIDMEGQVTKEGEAKVTLAINGNMTVTDCTRITLVDPGIAVGVVIDRIIQQLRKPIIVT